MNENYEHLRRLEELRDNLVHMIVHDLCNPLTGICGFLDLALDKKETAYHVAFCENAWNKIFRDDQDRDLISIVKERRQGQK